MRVKVRTAKRKAHTLVVLDYVDFHGKRRRVTVGKARGKRDLEPVLQEAKLTAKLVESALSDEGKYRYFRDHLVHKTFWPVRRACMLLLGEMEFRRYAVIAGVECQYRLPNDHPIVELLMEETRRFQHFGDGRGFEPIPTEDGVAVLREDFVEFAVRPTLMDDLPYFVKHLEDFIERAGFFEFEDLLPDSVQQAQAETDSTHEDKTTAFSLLREDAISEYTTIFPKVGREAAGAKIDRARRSGVIRSQGKRRTLRLDRITFEGWFSLEQMKQPDEVEEDRKRNATRQGGGLDECKVHMSAL